MRIFFAGARGKYLKLMLEMGVKNLLSSYENPRATEETAEALKVNYPGQAFLLDSGAFSAWNSSRVINLNEYINFAGEFIARHSDRISHIHVVNLDVIPGEQGRIPTRKEVEEAARLGWENMIRMEKAGLTPLHIFHQGEDFKWLERLSERHRYIGISPSNDSSLKNKKLWMDAVYARIRAKNMTHGFAVTSRLLMERFPWFSVDSTSWMAPQIYGKAVFSREFEAMDLSSRCRSHVDYVIMENVRVLRRLQKKYTALWRGRGVVWDEDET
jgi:hypothetical protein